MKTTDLNRDDETFLRQDQGFQHRGVIQIREFLDAGEYWVKLQATEKTATTQRIMPRCEAYIMGLQISPISSSASEIFGEECLDTHYVPEHLVFDTPSSGKLSYPVSESVVDVAYIDLKSDGEGPFMFYFSINYDPRVIGIIGLSLHKYDNDKSTFSQSALYRMP